MAFPGKKSPSDLENRRTRVNTPQVQLPHAQVDAFGRPTIDPHDNLNLFRHLVGVVSHPSMSYNDDSRPAPNLGIYARVIHNEQKSKAGFKYFSMLINGCLGLQIVVAATLTALGAAGGSRGAVTVFGAINTVIAGILTFLKGSGLPNRFKYYQTEWKRIREFIEQRERDFTRPNCDLDVYGVVAMVEQMYDEVKADLEASQPDRFAGANVARRSVLPEPAVPAIKFPSALLPRVQEFSEKGKEIEEGFGNKVKNITSEISHFAQQAREAAKDFQAHGNEMKEGASHEVRGFADRVGRMEHMFGDKVKDLAAEIGDRAHIAEKLARDAKARGLETMDGAVSGARGQISSFDSTARGLAHDVGARGQQTIDGAVTGARGQMSNLDSTAKSMVHDFGARGQDTMDSVAHAGLDRLDRLDTAVNDALKSPITINVSHSGAREPEKEKKLAEDY